MPSLSQHFDNLLKPLSLEVKQRFVNRSVLGGLDKHMVRRLDTLLASMGKTESNVTGLLHKLRADFSKYSTMNVVEREKLVLDCRTNLAQIKNITIFDLIENAKESLDHAIDHYTKSSPSLPNDLKRVLLDITHVVELLLKERLHRINPSLIWKNIDQYPDEKSETVSSDFAFRRLVKIGGLQFTENIKNVIDDAIELRNKIIHYKFRIEDKEAHVLIGKLMSFILDFSTKHLSLDWEEEFKQSPKWALMMKDRDLWIVHKPVIENRMIEENKITFECPSCDAQTFNLDSGDCELCGHNENVQECDECGEKFPDSLLNYFDGDDETGPVTICNGCYHKGEEEDYYSD